MSTGKIIECVPNFSEGQNQETIDAIARAIRESNGCSLLDVDAGLTTNRTVYTFVGSPEAVVAGAMAAAREAYKHIDMAKHQGSHPRMGAMDVCPFVPVSNATIEDCVGCSKALAEQLSSELGVPVFLYEAAQDKVYRRALQDIRNGEYEGLKDKLAQSEWAPDYGPATFVSRWGASVVGARKFLIAFNVNLLATKEQANRIAFILRESGGPSSKRGGRLKCVKALGWYLEEHQLSQVSMNLTDTQVTPLHTAYEECCREARKLKLGVVGSEIVGLVPLGPILAAADYYIEREGLFVLHERQRVRLAVDRLGLSSIAEFRPEEKIIEYRVGSHADGPLVSGTVRGFVEQVSARTSSPGGGSTAALVASMGAALGAMVGQLSFGNRKYESLDSLMRGALPPLHHASQQLLPLVDRDTRAFNSYMAALRLPKGNQQEMAEREEAMQAGLREAIEVPLTVVRLASGCWDHMITMAANGNESALSDIQVGCCSLATGVRGAYYNVLTNLTQVKDGAYIATITTEVEKMLRESDEKCQKALSIASGRQNKT